jgi:hypothetical protein
MNVRVVSTLAAWAVLLSLGLVPAALAQSPAPQASPQPVNHPDVAAIRAADERLVAAFNAGKADQLALLFHPEAEFIDEEGPRFRICWRSISRSSRA